MNLRTILHTAGIFLSVSLAMFIANYPAVPVVWKAAIIAVITGLAAVGITPPWVQPSVTVAPITTDDKLHEMLVAALSKTHAE